MADSIEIISPGRFPIDNLLVFDTDKKLVNALKKKGLHPILVKPGAAFKLAGDRVYEVNPGSQTDYQQLVHTLESNGQLPGSIIHFWSKQSFQAEEDAMRLQLARGVYSIFYLIKDLLDPRLKKDIHLLYVYSGSPGDVQPQYEAVSGFARSVSVENPRFDFKTLGISPISTQVAEIVCAELQAMAGAEREVSYEGKQRWVHILREVCPGPKIGDETLKKAGWQENGVYVITGGTGGLGLLFAEHITRQVKAKIVLISRSDPGAEALERMEQMRSSGSELVHFRTDISRKPDVEKVFEQIRSRFGEIHGIIHAAGVIRDSLLIKKTTEEVDATLAPKVWGTMALDEVSREDNLDFFVMFSSISSVFGNVGQLDYAYANRFMDGFARLREKLRAKKKRKGKTVSINWPLWQEGGMKVDEFIKKMMGERFGLGTLTTQAGLDALDVGLCLDTPDLGLVVAAREKIAEIFHIQPPIKTVEQQEQEILDREDLAEDIRQMTEKELEIEMESILKGLGV